MRNGRSHRGGHVRCLVVIGASAGGLRELSQIVSAFPSDLPAAVMIAMHTSPGGAGRLAEVLDRAGRLSSSMAKNGDPIAESHIYVAPPDHHLIISDGRMQLGRGPRENGFRPAVDPLFRSAAKSYGHQVIGVILSGALSDGAQGLESIMRRGGVGVVQDPADAIMPGMPQSALARAKPDYVLRGEQIANELVGIVIQRAERGGRAVARRASRDPARVGRPELLRTKDPDARRPSPFTCPECGGVLWTTGNGGADGYRCHVGHTFGEDGLVALQSERLDRAMWTAVRSLEEGVALRRRMAGQARKRGLEEVASGFDSQAESLRERADAVWHVLDAGLVAPDETVIGPRRPPDVKADHGETVETAHPAARFRTNLRAGRTARRRRRN